MALPPHASIASLRGGASFKASLDEVLGQPPFDEDPTLGLPLDGVPRWPLLPLSLPCMLVVEDYLLQGDTSDMMALHIVPETLRKQLGTDLKLKVFQSLDGIVCSRIMAFNHARKKKACNLKRKLFPQTVPIFWEIFRLQHMLYSIASKA